MAKMQKQEDLGGTQPGNNSKFKTMEDKIWTPDLESAYSQYVPSQTRGPYLKPYQTRKKLARAQMSGPISESTFLWGQKYGPLF